MKPSENGCDRSTFQQLAHTHILMQHLCQAGEAVSIPHHQCPCPALPTVGLGSLRPVSTGTAFSSAQLFLSRKSNSFKTKKISVFFPQVKCLKFLLLLSQDGCREHGQSLHTKTPTFSLGHTSEPGVPQQMGHVKGAEPCNPTRFLLPLRRRGLYPQDDCP